jgi:hypothetical protein
MISRKLANQSCTRRPNRLGSRRHHCRAGSWGRSGSSAKARRTAVAKAVRSSGSNPVVLGSRTTTSLRKPSIKGRATSVGTLVTRSSQYDESRGVNTGTRTIQRCRPRIDASSRIMAA